MKIIKSENLCCSCTACVETCSKLAIEMHERQGFYYPAVNEELCINCGKCSKVCPLNITQKQLVKGHYYAAVNAKDTDRLQSTSGGVFSLLAEYVLSKNGIVYGASYDDYGEIIHVAVDQISDLHKLRGAKYAQSDLGHTFSEIKTQLKNEVPVLFSGTPCQVAGLYAFLGKSYDNLIMVDLVCHGIPSQTVWREYLAYRQRIDQQTEPVRTINLRSKSTGWSRYSYSVSFQYPSGFEYTVKNSDDPYMKAFISNMTIRPSCTECQFKDKHRYSDFTLGDFWGVWDSHPEMDDNKGTSLVAVNTDRGREIWAKISETILVKEVSEKDAISQNPSYRVASPKNPLSEELMERLDSEGFDCVMELLERQRREKEKSIGKRSLMRRVASKVKRFLG